MATFETILAVGAQLLSSFGATFSKIKQEFDTVKDASKGMEGGIKETTDSIGKSFSSLKGKLVGAAVGAGMVATGKKAIDLASNMEKLQTAMEVHLKSPVAAQQLITEMQAFAKESAAFSFPDIAHAGKQMLAYGFAAKEVIPQMKTLSDVASGLEIPLTDLTYLYGTLRVQGRAYTKDIQQFTNRGIPVWEALAEVMSKTGEAYTIGKGKNAYEVSGDQIKEVGKIQELVTAGQVDFEKVQKAFELMTSEGGKFYQMGEKQGETFSGRMNTLTDSVDQLLTKLGSPLIDVFGNALKALNDSGAINAIAAGLGELSKHMGIIAPIAVTLAGAFVAMEIATKVAAGIKMMGAAMAGARAAMIVFNALMLANPIGLIILGVTALVTAIALLVANWESVTAAAKSAFEWMGKALNVTVPEAPTDEAGRLAIAKQAEQAGAGAGISEALAFAPPSETSYGPEVAKAVETAPIQEVAKVVEAAPPAPPPPVVAPEAGPSMEDLSKSMDAYNKAVGAAQATPEIKPEVNAAELEIAKTTVDELANISVPNLNSAVSGVGSSFNSWSVPSTLLAQMDQVVAKANEVKIAMAGVGSAGPAVGGAQFGGLVSRPGLWRLAEKGVPEMVIPMQQNQRSIGLLAQAANELGVGGIGSNRGTASSPMNVSVSIPITVNGASSGQEGAIGREIQRAMQDPVRTLLEQLKRARDEEHRQSYV